MRISDWSSDVCSSDLLGMIVGDRLGDVLEQHGLAGARRRDDQRALALALRADEVDHPRRLVLHRRVERVERELLVRIERGKIVEIDAVADDFGIVEIDRRKLGQREIALAVRSEEHTSELQSLMRISYAVFCLTKKNNILLHASNHLNIN